MTTFLRVSFINSSTPCLRSENLTVGSARHAPSGGEKIDPEEGGMEKISNAYSDFWRIIIIIIIIILFLSLQHDTGATAEK